MADRFQNGLYLYRGTASQVGRVFQRWLVEFATQICGWTLVDEDSTLYTNTKATGTGGASVVGEPAQLDVSADGTPFTVGVDEGRYITIHAGMPSGFEDRHGIYRITKVVSSSIVELDILFGVHDAGIPHPSSSLSWRLWSNDASDTPGYSTSNWAVIQGTGTQQAGTYNFQARIISSSDTAGYPDYEVGPFANWNTGTNSWDSAATSGFNGHLSNNSDACRVFAVGDSSRIVVGIRNFDDNIHWDFLYLGEIDANYDETIDPNPVIVWNGNNGTNDTELLFGAGLTGGAMHVGGRGLSYDNTTTLAYYASLYQVEPYANNNWFANRTQRRSSRTTRFYRQNWMVEARSSGHMELRGKLRRTWLGCRSLDRGFVFGRNGEFLHLVGGIVIPWNGSGMHEQRV